MKRRLQFGLAMLLTSVLLMPVTLRAADPLPLPDFRVVDATGATIESKDVVRKGKWLLIYVHGMNGPSTSLLRLLQSDKFADVGVSATIIVGGLPANKLEAFSQRYPILSAAAWYADPDGKAMQSLNLHGVPVVTGMADEKMNWSLAGVLRDDNRMQSVIMTWVTK